MRCKQCVENTQLARENAERAEDMVEENNRLKRINSILRRVNGKLRRYLQRHLQSSDELFLQVCEADTSADLAIGELWGSGEFDCGPQDYDTIVELCLAAIREYKERRTQPSIGATCHKATTKQI